MVKEISSAERKIGVNFRADTAEILVWAPAAEKVTLIIPQLERRDELLREEHGYWGLQTSWLEEGMPYWFELQKGSNKLLRADPASLLQRDGVHGPSLAFNVNNYPFADKNWKGIPLHEYIIYEIHVGAFTPAGTFAAIVNQLDYLIELGITAIELMPVASFPGNRNWGYDGVFPFAVQESYGGPIGLQHLVDACHAKGIAVILDVVYNHFGPEGNYFADFGPYFTDKYQTPWGSAINFDDAYADGVRHFFMENVLMWFRDFHIDALRLDAVHAIKDLSAQHILAEIKAQVERLNATVGKRHYLIIECDLNNPQFLHPLSKNGYGMDAQWMDDFHHALRVTAGQKRTGYYSDFNGIAHLAKSYQHAYVYDGLFSEARQQTFGSSAEFNESEQFVVFSQNHDQVGNRMLGERSAQLYSFSMQKLIAGAVLVSPFVPLLFMGEEWGETNPFLYFVSHSDPELIKAVRKGRAAEFEAFQEEGEAPDPQDEHTFIQSKLQWGLLSTLPHQQLFVFYKALLRLRKTHPVLKSLNRKELKVEVFTEQNCLILHRSADHKEMKCFLNFSSQVQEIPFPDFQNWQKILDSNEPIFGGESESYFMHENQILVLQPECILIYTKYDV